jgi:RecA/RadA recombinase
MAKKRSFASRVGNTLGTINTPTFRTGFSKVDLWIGTSNYAMNRLWSGDFNKALLFGRNYIFYGESGSGKSLFSAIAAGNAQKEHDALVVWIDVEHANDDEAGREWLSRAGLDLDEEKFMYTSASTLEEIKTIIAKISVDYQALTKAGETDLPPIVFVVDSWAAALTSSQWDKAGGKEAGRVVGDMGQKAKQQGDVINAVTHLCAGLPIMVIGVQHIMDNQDGYGRKHKTTGGNKMLYFASGCIMLSKKELRLEDVDDQDIKATFAELDKGMMADVKKAAGGDKRHIGITATAEIIKSRVSKPFSKIDIQIPYSKGVDPYSGLFALLMQEGVITKGSPGWFEYTQNGEVQKFQKKQFITHAGAIMKIADDDISGAIDMDEETPDEPTKDT